MMKILSLERETGNAHLKVKFTVLSRPPGAVRGLKSPIAESEKKSSSQQITYYECH